MEDRGNALCFPLQMIKGLGVHLLSRPYHLERQSGLVRLTVQPACADNLLPFLFQQVMSMITSYPALLSLPRDGIDRVVNHIAALLAVSETEIITAARKQSQLLLLGVDDVLQKKVGMR